MTVSTASGLGRALFLDRDGVINVNHGYVHSVEKFEFVDGIFELVQAAKSAGFEVVVVTNQAGIARGYYSEAQFHGLMAWVREQFARRGGSIDKVYFSPYHPTAGIGEYRKDEDTRKPRPGMILQAQQELGLSLEDSILVGDQPSDIQAGHTAGVGLNVLYATSSPADLAPVPHLRVDTLEAVIPLLSRTAPESQP